MINIRKQIGDLFDTYSHDIVYVRRDIRFRCECYVERSGEPTTDCPKCFGTGFAVKIEKFRTRRKIASIPETLIGVNQGFEYGSLVPTAYVYYLENTAKPDADDLILEVVWDANGVPRKIKEKNVISAVDPMLGYKGRVEFYQVYCRYDWKGDYDDSALANN